MLKTLHKLGLDSTQKVRVRDVEVSPRDVVAATLPDPMTLGDRMVGKTCAGTLVTGLGKDGRPRKTYLYHVVDNEWSMREYGSQAVVWQTALNPVVRARADRRGRLEGHRRARPGVVPGAAVPRQARRARLAARGARARAGRGLAAALEPGARVSPSKPELSTFSTVMFTTSRVSAGFRNG